MFAGAYTEKSVRSDKTNIHQRKKVEKHTDVCFTET